MALMGRQKFCLPPSALFRLLLSFILCASILDLLSHPQILSFFFVIFFLMSCPSSHSSAFHPDFSTPTSSLVSVNKTISGDNDFVYDWRIQGYNCKVSPKKPADRECSADLRRSHLCHQTFGSCEKMERG